MKVSFLHAKALKECTARNTKYFENYYAFCMINRGKVNLSYDQQKMTLEAGNTFLFYPGPLISFSPFSANDSWEHRYVAFKGSRVDFWNEHQLLSKDPQKSPSGAYFIHLFDQLIEQVNNTTTTLEHLKAANYLEELLILSQEFNSKNESSNWKNHVIQTLEENIGFVLDYEKLAIDVGMSLSHMRKRFKESFGISLHDYAIQLKINRAKSLLQNSSDSAQSISIQLGYADPAFFARQFKKVTGFTTQQFRNHTF